MEPIEIGKKLYSPGEVPLLIAGPCVLEDEGEALRLAEECASLAERLGFFYIFKASYLKDNRSSVDSYTGPGLEKGLKILSKVRERADVPVLTDVHCRGELHDAAEVCDVLQIPAFLSRQTRLVMSAAATGRVLNLKKGQFLSPEEMGLVVEKARSGGAVGLLITERGTCFGYNNLVVDFTAFPRMRRLGAPLVLDVTHSLQLPGRLGARSGGRPEYAAVLASASMAAGCDGLFIETHFEPGRCLCDADAMLPFGELEDLLGGAAELFRLSRSIGGGWNRIQGRD